MRCGEAWDGCMSIAQLIDLSRPNYYLICVMQGRECIELLLRRCKGGRLLKSIAKTSNGCSGEVTLNPSCKPTRELSPFQSRWTVFSLRLW